MTGAFQVKLAENAPVDAPPGGSGPPVSVQQLWLAIQKQEWSSLVLVPTGPGISAFEAARTLHQTGQLIMGDRLRLIDARGINLTGTVPLILEMTSPSPVRPASEPRSERTLVVIDSVLSQPSGIPIALAADAALLCVELGRTVVTEARETLRLIGLQRFVGCLTFPSP